MPSAEQAEANAQTVNDYVTLIAQGRKDEIVALYADDATVEDPVGSEVHVGRQAINTFYVSLPFASAETEIVTLRALGNEAAFFWRLTVGSDDSGKAAIEILSTMAFTDDGKIAAMKAYWGPENVTPL
ncbi:MAG: nuclear transport factor 2 family protein [Actinobacteria bacterium]|nr:nuclear transport factor 2 family protein [Actinomycetota bacterium]